MSIIPERLRRQVQAELQRRDDDIRSIDAVSGGCINHGARLETARGRYLFLKWSPEAPAGMYRTEADGLDALRTAVQQASGAGGRRNGLTEPPLRVPAVIAIGEDPPDARWLLMEFIAPGDVAPAGAALGRWLADIHGSLRREDFGWRHDNWIGSLPQPNTPSPSWGAFWRDMRIVPQLQQARAAGYLRSATLDRLVDRIVPALEDVTRPELLHGDLWSGNSYTATTGEPVLIDPAIYAGDGEVDLAMTELFGGFGPDFYEAYRARRPVSDAYLPYRRDLYQLYYLLVHVNLFGASYTAAAQGAAERVLATLGRR